MTYYVNRQCYWGVDDNPNVVEIASGGSDYANPDQLVPKYRGLGEGQEFTNPIDAVEAAIAVCKAWRKDGERKAMVAHGATGGFTMPFDSCNFREARAWAKEAYEKTPKCAGCNEPMGNRKWFADDWSGQEYCSEYCAQKEAEYQERENARFEAEESEAI